MSLSLQHPHVAHISETVTLPGTQKYLKCIIKDHLNLNDLIKLRNRTWVKYLSKILTLITAVSDTLELRLMNIKYLIIRPFGSLKVSCKSFYYFVLLCLF